MRHDRFAEQAARKLEDIAKEIDGDEQPLGGGITAMRANELRVAACVVRDLSRVATGEEEEGDKHLPPDVPSREDPLGTSQAAPPRVGAKLPE